MMGRFFGYWKTLGSFDRLGAGLVGWEFLSLAAGIVALPLAEHRLIPAAALRALAVNGIALGTALVAWVVTHVLVAARPREHAGETLQEFMQRKARASRSR